MTTTNQTIEAASVNTKDILKEVLRLELTALNPTLTAMAEELQALSPRILEPGVASEIAAKTAEVKTATDVKAKAEQVLADVNDGKTRNSTGAAVKQVRAFTKRNVLAEAAAAWIATQEAAKTEEAEPVADPEPKPEPVKPAAKPAAAKTTAKK